jgi:hypothetical protein
VLARLKDNQETRCSPPCQVGSIAGVAKRSAAKDRQRQPKVVQAPISSAASLTAFSAAVAVFLAAVPVAFVELLAVVVAFVA